MFWGLLFLAFVAAPDSSPTSETDSARPRAGRLIERIEARVGTQIIVTSEVAAAEDSLRKEQPNISDFKLIRQRAMDALIDQALVRDYLQKRDLTVGDQEIDRRINSLRSAQGLQDFEELKRILLAQGTSLDQVRLDLRRQLEIQNFYGSLRRENLQTIQEAEIKAFYQMNLDRFKNNYELQVQECLLPADLPEHDKLIKEFSQKPGSFDVCVKKYSRSPSAERGGRLGSITRGILRETVEIPLFKTPVGKVSAVNLPAATQLLKVISRKDLGAQSIEQARDEIVQALEAEKMEKAKDRVLAELKSSIFIKVES